MEVSLITHENRKYFERLFPDKGERFWDIELGAIDEGIPCGILLSDMHKDVLTIRWLYVDPEYWGEGAGSELLNSLNLMARTLGVKMTTISYGDLEYESELDGFLESRGFANMDDDSDFFEMKLKDMEAFYEETKPVEKKFTGTIIPLGDITKIIWNKLRAYTESGVDIENGDDGAKDPPNHTMLLDKLSDYDRELSLIMVDDDEPTGCILVQSGGDELMVSYLLNRHRDEPMDAVFLVHHCIGEARRKFPPETTVYMKAVSEMGRAVAKKVSNNKAKLVSKIKSRYVVY